MAILTNEEKRSILFRAQTDFKRYDGLEKNYRELYAALKIIEKTFGEQWYNKSTKNLEAQTSTKIPLDHNYVLEGTKFPPLTTLLIGGAPSNIVRITQFATYIKELWNVSNIQDKINDYVYQERKGELSFEHFERLLFEIKVGAICKDRGLDVQFILKQQRIIPDIKLTSSQGKTYVECKKKDLQVKLSREIVEIYKKIEVGLLNDMSKLRLNYLVKITFDREAKDTDINPIIAVTNKNFLKQLKYFKENFDNIIVEGKQLMGLNIDHSSKDIPELPDEKDLTAQHYDICLETKYPQSQLLDFIKLREIDIPIRNFKMVAVYSSFEPSRVQSILNSIKDASAQLLKSSGYGIIAIEILHVRATQKEVKELFHSLPTLVKDMPHISAILLFVEATLEGDGLTHKRTICHMYLNPLTSFKLPQDIEAALKTNFTRPHKSLLDD